MNKACFSLLITLIYLMGAITNTGIVVATTEKTREKATDFLSSVVGIDLTKYSLVQPSFSNYTKLNQSITTIPINMSYPLFDPQIKFESFTLNCTSNSGIMEIQFFFYNDRMHAILINSGYRKYYQDQYFYLEKAPTDTINQAVGILEKYQDFVSREYSSDGSYLEPMRNILKSANGAPLKSQTIGNIKFVIEQSNTKTDLQWIYVKNGVSMGNWKRVSMSFSNNSLTEFHDTWGLYQVDESKVISSGEALKIALTAAQNYKLVVIHEDGTNETVPVPDLSKTYRVNLNYLPYREQSEHILPSNVSRDPFTLYPLWDFSFFFPQGKIGGESGIQVGVLADTGEVAYCTGFGYFSSEEPTGIGQLAAFNVAVVSVIVIIAILAVVALFVVLQQRRKRRFSQQKSQAEASRINLFCFLPKFLVYPV